MFEYYNSPTYAGFWLRVVAYIIDALILGVIFVPLGLLIGLLMLNSGFDQNSPLFELLNQGSNVLSILAGWLYYAFLESSAWQGTIGKKALGLRVTDMNGQRITFARATGRYFGSVLSSMICFIGYIMVAFTEKKQGLHDLIAGTLVLSGPAPPINQSVPPPPPDFRYRQSGI